MIKFSILSFCLFILQILILRMVANGNEEAVIFSLILFIDFIMSFIITFVINFLKRIFKKKSVLLVSLVCVLNLFLFLFSSHYHIVEMLNELKYSLLICNFATLVFMIYSTICMDKKST